MWDILWSVNVHCVEFWYLSFKLSNAETEIKLVYKSINAKTGRMKAKSKKDAILTYFHDFEHTADHMAEDHLRFQWTKKILIEKSEEN